jgi:glycosyltransferase involved in cell wall biosynthesis
MGQIAFFIPNLNGGGAERALLNLLTYWPDNLKGSWQPILIVRECSGPLVTDLPADLAVESLGLARSGTIATLRTVGRLAARLRQHRPRAVISFLSLPSVFLATRIAGTGARFLASIQNPPVSSASDATTARLARSYVARPIGRVTYRHADLLLPITPGIAQEVAVRFGVPSVKLKVIPNSVDLARIDSARYQSSPIRDRRGRDHTLVTACRLVPQKRVDVLLRSISLLPRHLEVQLLILGEGPERDHLERLAEALGIADCCHFLGFRNNPWQVFSQASLFVLTSDYEGFGNVIIEAMACGLPIVATRAPYGPEYIIENEEQGVLVPVDDPAAVADAIIRVLESPILRQTLVREGRKRAEQFDVRRVFPRFWDAIEPLLGPL